MPATAQHGTTDKETDVSTELRPAAAVPRVDRLATAHAQHAPDAVALVSQEGERLSYAELDRMVDRTAAALAAHGVRAGDRVAVFLENSLNALPMVLGAMRAGAWAVPLNARLTEAEATAIVRHAGPKAILCCVDGSQAADRHARRLGCVAMDGLPDHVAVSVQGQATDTLADRPDVAVLIYTSGTTGVPKGVMLTHANLGFVMGLAPDTGWFRAGERVYSVLPLSHSYGLVTVGLSALGAGATLMPVRRFAAEHAAEAIRSGAVQAFLGVPTLYDRLIHHAADTGTALTPNALRIAYVGGAPLDPERKARAEALLGVTLANGYGLTEASPTVTRTAPGTASADLSVGLPVPGVAVELRDGGGAPVAADQDGRLFVRGPNVMAGYYKDPDGTRAVLDDRGWLDTGDIARRDARGRLFIVGRAKDVIIRSGFNVYPEEVERALNALPGVALSAVIGARAGADEQVLAWVQPEAGATLAPDAMIAAVKQRLAPYKVPAHIHVVDALPLTATGKVRKAALAALLPASAKPGVAP